MTNQVVSKTSTPKKIDKEAVMDYIAEARKKAESLLIAGKNKLKKLWGGTQYV